MLDQELVLKSDELYLVGASTTDGSGESAAGLYVRDTRHLSRFRLLLNDAPLQRLSARVARGSRAVVVETNSLQALPGVTIAPHTISVEQTIELGDRLLDRIVVHNYGPHALSLALSIEIAADFRDLFDIRGFPRRRTPGTLPVPALTPTSLDLRHVAVDGVATRTLVTFDRPTRIDIVDRAVDAASGERAVVLPGFEQVPARPRPPEPPTVVAAFGVELEPGGEWSLLVTIQPRPAEAAQHPLRPSGTDGEPPPAVVSTDSPALNRLLDRSAADLDLLQTSFPEGSLPAAGIPWFVAPFGRDSLIVGLQTLHLAPGRAASTLRVLAALQGVREDPVTEEEPGKILHEMRYGEMARLREIPHTPYYGSVDATPLFLLLFAETVAWTADDGLYDELLPNARRACEWIERFGDLDDDGLVEYRRGPADGSRIVHQGWKDSHDSLHHRDGRAVAGPVALVEVQGYVVAAYRRLAEVVSVRGDGSWAEALAARSEALRRSIEERFWLADEGFYAQALDGEKTPVRAITSNPGHPLFCRVPSPERAAVVAERLLRPDLDSGWGIRTLGATMPTYNPMSYHNGSVWPHDNSLAAAGLFAYGHAEAGQRVARSLVAAGSSEPLARLPELYCGFPRAGAGDDGPVAYPVSCSPQAWAAAAPQLLVRAMLGLDVDLAARRLIVAPLLPPWLNEVRIERLCVFGQLASLTVRRSESGHDIRSSGDVVVAGPGGDQLD